MPRRIESLFLEGPVGRLEALLEEPDEDPPREAVLVCHPHPQGGGTMHNKVVYRIARGLRQAGAVVLRFNYRGVNQSEGQFDSGLGEAEDSRAALRFLRERYPGLPYTLAGFSFGSRIVLGLGCALRDASKLIAVGFPASYPGSHALGQCDLPRYFIQSTRDEFGPIAAMTDYFQQLRGPKELVWVDAQDHFFAGALDSFEGEVMRVGSIPPRSPAPDLRP